MTKYTEIEIQTANNLLKEGYKWIARDESGGLFAYTDKPIKLDTFWCSDGISNCVCYYVPIFQSIRSDDKEPVSLESIVHPQILDDAEKRYLSAVIKPFRDEVMGISKLSTYDCSKEWLFFIGKKNSSLFDLPRFKAGTLYKGMKKGHDYTPEELGL
ncbi:MAG: hypothetical protein MR666_08235 [Dialister sp.]|nr:hypothetical protein [Dialister sp.]